VSGMTAEIAAWIAGARFADLSEQAVRFATDAITDCVGVALAGSRQPLGPRLMSALDTWPAGRDASGHHLLGTLRRANATDAALYNGTVAHALDYDDINHPGYSHPSAHLMPALFAAAKDVDATGEDVILAYAIGFEMQGRLGLALNVGEGIPNLRGHYARGWHATGTFGTMAAAAAVASLFGLDEQRIRRTLGIAGTSASGLRATFGTMSKPLNAGLAARNGVLAARLAAADFEGPEDIFEDRFGFLAVLSDGAWLEEPLLQMGRPWQISTEHGLALKAYPACGATHPAIEAALRVRAQVGGDDIVEVRVGHNEVMPAVLVYDDPKSPLEGKFSMQFCVAAALVTGRVRIDTFGDETLARQDVRDLMSRIVLQVDDRVRLNSEHGAAVSVRCRSGREVEELVPLAKGKPERWLSSDDLFAKFLDCSNAVLGDGGARRLFDTVQDLPRLASLTPIFDALDKETTVGD